MTVSKKPLPSARRLALYVLGLALGMIGGGMALGSVLVYAYAIPLEVVLHLWALWSSFAAGILIFVAGLVVIEYAGERA